MTADHYVYRLYDANDRLLYVGRSCDVAARLRCHAAHKPWWPAVTRHTVSEPMHRLDAIRAERSAIHCERPLYNVRHNPRRAA